jgi:hypothetical protein
MVVSYSLCWKSSPIRGSRVSMGSRHGRGDCQACCASTFRTIQPLQLVHLDFKTVTRTVSFIPSSVHGMVSVHFPTSDLSNAPTRESWKACACPIGCINDLTLGSRYAFSTMSMLQRMLKLKYPQEGLGEE